MHGRAPSDYLRGKDRIRGVIAAMRQHLKKANYHNFGDLLSAFKYYDKVSGISVEIGVSFHKIYLKIIFGNNYWYDTERDELTLYPTDAINLCQYRLS